MFPHGKIEFIVYTKSIVWGGGIVNTLDYVPLHAHVHTVLVWYRVQCIVQVDLQS